MKNFFPKCYDFCLNLASKKYAEYYLYFISFIESIFFPIPTDVALAPVAMRKPKKWFRLAFFTALFSLFGGLIGFLFGKYGIEYIVPILEKYGYIHRYETIIGLFNDYGYIIVLAAGLTPLPFKIFTIASGAFGVNLYVFIIMAFISRLIRYIIISLLFAKIGAKYETQIRDFIAKLGWAILLILIAIVIVLFLKR